jgi:hypothetical protein
MQPVVLERWLLDFQFSVTRCGTELGIEKFGILTVNTKK